MACHSRRRRSRLRLELGASPGRQIHRDIKLLFRLIEKFENFLMDFGGLFLILAGDL